MGGDVEQEGGAMNKTITCARCCIQCPASNNRQKYCPDCAAEIQRGKLLWLKARDDAMTEADCEYYAAFLERQRNRGRRFRERHLPCQGRKRNGGMYVARLNVRLPDWTTKGKIVALVNSPWMINNITDSQRAYARELAIERKAQREAL